MKKINLNGTIIGNNLPVYIVAEIGQNHNGDIDIAEKLIDMASRCGANAVKFQKRDIPSELTEQAFSEAYINSNSYGKTYGEHREFLELNEEQHRHLKNYAKDRNITYFCTPCDILSVEMLERLDCPFFKVASRDITNIPLLNKLATLNKPIIFSTGMADLEDINQAMKFLKSEKNEIIIMHCTSQYPCKIENVNFNAITTLKEKFGTLVGMSDHTSGVIIGATSIVYGAVVVEKHITLNRTMKGTDHPGSLEEVGLRKLVEYIRAIELAKGDGIIKIKPAVFSAKDKLMRSLTNKIKINKGDILKEDMLELRSPGTGLKWIEKNKIINKKSLLEILPNTTLKAEYFESNE
jgi:sialic acid synthase SpsE